VSEAGFLAKSRALAAKDMRLEARARETLVPMLVFSLAVALLLGFSLPDPLQGPASGGAVVAGFLWVTVMFAGLIGFARTMEIERRDGALDTLLLVPLDRSGLFLAKAVANLAGIVAVEALVLPAFALLFGLELGGRWLLLVLVTVLVDVGFVATGTLLAAVAAQTRSRELVLPLLALPVLVPLFIAAVELSADLFGGETLAALAARGWFGVLVAFDVVTAAAGALFFEFALE
jgi:heme exporter protein B